MNRAKQERCLLVFVTGFNPAQIDDRFFAALPCTGPAIEMNAEIARRCVAKQFQEDMSRFDCVCVPYYPSDTDEELAERTRENFKKVHFPREFLEPLSAYFALKITETKNSCSLYANIASRRSTTVH